MYVIHAFVIELIIRVITHAEIIYFNPIVSIKYVIGLPLTFALAW
jgi:hypothetical protein